MLCFLIMFQNNLGKMPFCHFSICSIDALQSVTRIYDMKVCFLCQSATLIKISELIGICLVHGNVLTQINCVAQLLCAKPCSLVTSQKVYKYPMISRSQWVCWGSVMEQLPGWGICWIDLMIVWIFDQHIQPELQTVGLDSIHTEGQHIGNCWNALVSVCVVKAGAKPGIYQGRGEPLGNYQSRRFYIETI